MATETINPKRLSYAATGRRKYDTAFRSQFGDTCPFCGCPGDCHGGGKWDKNPGKIIPAMVITVVRCFRCQEAMATDQVICFAAPGTFSDDGEEG